MAIIYQLLMVPSLPALEQDMYIAQEQKEFKLNLKDVCASNENPDKTIARLSNTRCQSDGGHMCHLRLHIPYSGNRSQGLSDLLKSAMSSISDKHWLM